MCLDNFENIDDVSLIDEEILKLREENLSIDQYKEEIKEKTKKLLENFQEKESLVNQSLQIKSDYEKRLIDYEQQIMNSKKDFEEQINQYQQLEKQFLLYKEENQAKKSRNTFLGSSINFLIDAESAVLNIEQSPPPVQSNDWLVFYLNCCSQL